MTPTIPLQERAQQVLKATDGHTPGEWRLHGPTLKGDFWLYAPRDPNPGEHFVEEEEPIHFIAETLGSSDASALIYFPTLRALLAETIEALAQAEAELSQIDALLARRPALPGRSRLDDLQFMLAVLREADPRTEVAQKVQHHSAKWTGQEGAAADAVLARPYSLDGDA
ncbi:hypothetical protein [Deinococcus multiflagellatus]|uniref:Uncharacterized protein n=1 Tax=Deinococcus multiflagellatus TaxID=1656887 RepID=A0ABW1ZF19_9DEIO|nr:hypothetical protein [Deinococcus multiflagellatus]MBZ9712156.1 hypothetical protein [Deinococcus multiflagellatus]